MYTVLPSGKFVQIQICPPFLTWALPAANSWTVLLDPSYWLKLTLGLAKQITSLTSYTPIDGVSIFDVTMLHEVTDS